MYLRARNEHRELERLQFVFETPITSETIIELGIKYHQIETSESGISPLSHKLKPYLLISLRHLAPRNPLKKENVASWAHCPPHMGGGRALPTAPTQNRPRILPTSSSSSSSSPAVPRHLKPSSPTEPRVALLLLLLLFFLHQTRSLHS